jgi:hypothetical protein
MSGLRKRTRLFSAAAIKEGHPLMRGFHAPQRDHAAPVQHPKPMCGMCGGKVHTRTDYRAPDENRGFPYYRRGDVGWWLCPSCDTGPEVGMPRAA